MIRDDIMVQIAKHILSTLSVDSTPDEIRRAAIDGMQLVDEGKLPIQVPKDGTVPDMDAFVDNQYVMVDKINMLSMQLTALLEKLIALKNTVLKNQAIENVSVQTIDSYLNVLTATDDIVVLAPTDIETYTNMDVSNTDFKCLKKLAADSQVTVDVTCGYFIYDGDTALRDSPFMDSGNPPPTVNVNLGGSYAVVRLSDTYRVTNLSEYNTIWALQKLDPAKHKIGIKLTFRFGNPARSDAAVNISSLRFEIITNKFNSIEVVSITKDKRETTHISKVFKNNTTSIIYSEFDSSFARDVTVMLRAVPIEDPLTFTGNLVSYGDAKVLTDNAGSVT